MPGIQPFHSFHPAAKGQLQWIMWLSALLIAMTAMANGLTLEWSPNPESNIAGYKVYYGKASGLLTQMRDTGQATTCVLSDLAPSTTYYFALQAYDNLGLYSALSAQISYTTPPANSGVVKNADSAPLPVLGGKVQLGSVNLGAMREITPFTFTNNGTNTLTNLSFALSGAAAGDFQIMGSTLQGALLASSLKPGESITFGLVFSPKAPGCREAVLRLTGDQSDSALFEATLSAIGSYPFDVWLANKGVAGGADGNPDGDALNNLFEYAFGTNPAAAQGATVKVGSSGSLASRGAPGVNVITSPTFEFRGLFARRKDHANVGLIYRTQFSADLNIWQDSTAPHVVEGEDGEIEAVSVKAPASINGLPPRFFRVAVIQKGRLSLPEWLVAHGATGGATGNSDGDGLINLFEFAFGTDPKVPQAAVASELNGLVASRGAPTVRIPTTQYYWFRGLFCRRKDRDSHKLIYKPQFSHDLGTWVESPYPGVVMADDGEIEVVSVRSPDSIHGMRPRFFRVEVTIAP
jgi:hypothetical protein